MSDYDFKQLNDKEFEIFCSDLLGEYLCQRIERFKPGKDSGVDGRFFSSSSAEVVLQCKHWIGTPTKNLIRYLRDEEVEKIRKLNPSRYIIAVSNPLSRSEKQEILNSLAGFAISESDIFGREDLNDLLKRYPTVEKRHYKLWLQSSSVLMNIMNGAIIGRSQFSLDEILAAANKYVVTRSHEAALNVLERLGVVIISGEPGVGKTTLANHLCLHYAAKNFTYYKLSNDVREAEGVFDPDAKQIFYFDDFLGRNYLEALKGHEGSQIAQFIVRVSKNKKKRFVLTSRSTILTQGKILIDAFGHANLNRNEYELRIATLSEIDKAKILYSHIWHSGLSVEYIDELYQNRRYRDVINHRNFNPRLISYITDPVRLESYAPSTYWNYVSESLKNPADVWDNPFVAQIDDFARATVLLVVVHGRSISEALLNDAYSRFISLPTASSMKGRSDFLTNLKALTGCFLNRVVDQAGVAKIDLFNPSIGDYVIKRYSRDIRSIKNALMCLRTDASLSTLRGLLLVDSISQEQCGALCRELLRYVSSCDYEGFTTSYVSILANMCIKFSPAASVMELIASPLQFILKSDHYPVVEETFNVLSWAITFRLLDEMEVLEFVEKKFEFAEEYGEFCSLYKLLGEISNDCEVKDDVVNAVSDHMCRTIEQNFEEWVDINQAFFDVSYGDYDNASRKLESLVEDVLNDLGVFYTGTEISRIVSAYDVVGGLIAYYENQYESEDADVDAPSVLEVDEVEDLFDRRGTIISSNGEL